MTYTPQTWNNNDPSTPLNATRLAHIESGVSVADAASVNASALITGTVADARLPITAQAATLAATYGRKPAIYGVPYTSYGSSYTAGTPEVPAAPSTLML
jgi:hypothetical protein